jgi:G3E family GTPase
MRNIFMPEVDSQIPVFIITGFLGSGKTTLLNHLVNHDDMGETAVIINEFGEVGLDHLLVDSAFEDTILMQSGCICCSIRGDLIDTLNDLLHRVELGELPKFTRVVIETTGLADPAPVMQSVMSDPNVTNKFRLGGVVSTVDAVNGINQLDEYGEPVKQAAVAERILMTKTDISSEKETGSLTGRLREINPASPIFKVVMGEIHPDQLFDTDVYDPTTKIGDVEKWLMESSYEQERPHSHDDGDNHGHGHDHDHVDVNRHNSEIRAFCLVYKKPIHWEAFRTWIDSIISLRGNDLLRIKGIVNVEGSTEPVVVHGVQHVFHPPAKLNAWPEGDHTTRIVFITRNLELNDLEAALDAVNSV